MRMSSGTTGESKGITLRFIWAEEKLDAATTGDNSWITAAMRRQGAVHFFVESGSGHVGDKGKESVALIGLGCLDEQRLDRIRAIAGTCARSIRERGYRSATVDFRDMEPVLRACACALEEAAAAWAEGWLLGQYAFDKYKQSKTVDPIEQLHFIVETVEQATLVEAAFPASFVRANGTMLARDWCNEPVNRMNPHILAQKVREQFEKSAVEVKIFEGDELAEHGMNGLLTVGQGSQFDPAMIQLRYETDSALPLIALVGKGITFDMGGMNVKTGRDLSEARFDMGGACGVIGAVHILSELGVKANIVALIPTSDNVPDAAAFLPSTIIEYPNGLTVQVGNTDAEGRLVLADALLHAQRLGAAEIVDMATLTGNVGQALGLRMAGVWGDKASAELLHALGERNGDRNWPMPLIAEDEELLRSEYADLNNIGSSPYGGAIQAALFLARFVERGVRWNHIDMANTVYAKGTVGYYPVGASGYGARLLADYVIARVEEQRNDH